MKRTIYLLAAVGLALAALPAVAQFQNQAGGAAWEGKALRMAAIQQEPKVSRVLLLTLVADEARADHV